MSLKTYLKTQRDLLNALPEGDRDRAVREEWRFMAWVFVSMAVPYGLFAIVIVGASLTLAVLGDDGTGSTRLLIAEGLVNALGMVLMVGVAALVAPVSALLVRFRSVQRWHLDHGTGLVPPRVVRVRRWPWKTALVLGLVIAVGALLGVPKVIA